MNINNQLAVLGLDVKFGLIAILAIATFVFICQHKRLCRVCKTEIEEMIKAGIPLEVEILKGTYRVEEKMGENILRLVRICGFRQTPLSLKVLVPRRMFARIVVGNIYSFYYDYREQEIHFNEAQKGFSEPKNHTEASDLLQEEVIRMLFPLKTRILEKLAD